MNRIAVFVLVVLTGVALLGGCGFYAEKRIEQKNIVQKNEIEKCAIKDIKHVMNEYHLLNSGIMLNRKTDNKGNFTYELHIHNQYVSTLNKNELEDMLIKINDIFTGLDCNCEDFLCELETDVDSENIVIVSKQIDRSVKCASIL